MFLTCLTKSMEMDLYGISLLMLSVFAGSFIIY